MMIDNWHREGARSQDSSENVIRVFWTQNNDDPQEAFAALGCQTRKKRASAPSGSCPPDTSDDQHC